MARMSLIISAVLFKNRITYNQGYSLSGESISPVQGGFECTTGIFHIFVDDTSLQPYPISLGGKMLLVEFKSC